MQMEIDICKYNLLPEIHTKMIDFNTVKSTWINNFLHVLLFLYFQCFIQQVNVVIHADQITIQGKISPVAGIQIYHLCVCLLLQALRQQGFGSWQ